ncbi:hypothetical protein QQF64_015521 [Cirrhinus molitorella]|uniref:Uncharacterized protein n=1 Tax=Cirrhinus molitorella TaxID=172907 RepID=A0ABR3NVX8_9TELE
MGGGSSRREDELKDKLRREQAKREEEQHKAAINYQIIKNNLDKLQRERDFQRMKEEEKRQRDIFNRAKEKEEQGRIHTEKQLSQKEETN